MVWTAIAWLFGACALLWSSDLPRSEAVVLACGACAMLAALLRRPAVLGLAIGYALAWQQCTERLEARLDPALEGAALMISGSVASVPQDVGDGLRFAFAPEPRPGLPPLVEVTWYDAEWRPRAAERLKLDVRLRRPRGFANPGGADYEAQLLRKGIGATGYVRTAQRLVSDWRDVARTPVLVMRDRIAAALRDELGIRPATGIIAGLSVGLQDALSREQWRALS